MFALSQSNLPPSFVVGPMALAWVFCLPGPFKLSSPMGVVIPNEKDRAAIELGLTWSWKSFRFYYYFRGDVIMSPTGGGRSHCSLFWSSALMAEMLWACFCHPHGFLSILNSYFLIASVHREFLPTHGFHHLMVTTLCLPERSKCLLYRHQLGSLLSTGEEMQIL